MWECQALGNLDKIWFFMTSKSSIRANSMLQPVIPIVAGWIRENPGTLSLGQGVAYFDPPPEIHQSILAALEHSSIHAYGRYDGHEKFIELIHQKLLGENRIQVHHSHVVVTAGANMAFSHAINAVADPGEEVILPAPYYFNHHMALTQAGLHAVTVPTLPDYQLDLGAIERAITPLTRAVVTVSPNNPTGAVYPEKDLRSISSLCGKYGLTHISDEAYEYFAWLPHPHFSPASIPGAQTRTISLFSLSKSYGMAGWRLGYMLVPDSLEEAMRKIQDTQLICPPILSQMAAVSALERGRSWPEHFRYTIFQSQQAIQNVLNDWPQLCSYSNPQGAFYFLVRFHLCMSPEDLVKHWIQNFKIAVLPASTFGATGCTVRLSYGAIRPDALAEVIDRLRSALEFSANHPLAVIPSRTSP